MNNFLSLTLLFFITIFYGTNAQWYIIKKDYPSNLMNYPNPGKRSISEDKFHIDCSVPYAYVKSYEKTRWLLLCKDKHSPLITVDDSSSSSASSSNSNSMEDQIYYEPRLISHERRTARFIPPYLSEERNFYNGRLWNRFRRSTKN